MEIPILIFGKSHTSFKTAFVVALDVNLSSCLSAWSMPMVDIGIRILPTMFSFSQRKIIAPQGKAYGIHIFPPAGGETVWRMWSHFCAFASQKICIFVAKSVRFHEDHIFCFAQAQPAKSCSWKISCGIIIILSTHIQALLVSNRHNRIPTHRVIHRDGTP